MSITSKVPCSSLYWREDRHFYSWHLQNKASHTKTNRWINSTTGEKKQYVFLMLGWTVPLMLIYSGYAAFARLNPQLLPTADLSTNFPHSKEVKTNYSLINTRASCCSPLPFFQTLFSAQHTSDLWIDFHKLPFMWNLAILHPHLFVKGHIPKSFQLPSVSFHIPSVVSSHLFFLSGDDGVYQQSFVTLKQCMLCS